MINRLVIPMLLLGLGLLAVEIGFFGSKVQETKKQIKLEWVEVEIKVNFLDGTIQNYNIDVYEDLYNISLNQGDLSYIKIGNKPRGVVAYRVPISSYVKSYEVLSSELKSKPKY